MVDAMSQSSSQRGLGAEARRLAEDERRSHNWKRWGPYLSERQWGTVREDYSPHGTSWTDFPHRLIERLPGFARRLRWFLENRADLAQNTSYMAAPDREGQGGHRLLAIPSRERLVRVLRRVLDPHEFLSDHGIRSRSRVHAEEPFVFQAGSEEYRVAYVPGESDSGMFGGNSNWRGPVWFPLNYLLIEALERYHHFYGEGLQVECPTGSGRMMTLAEVARELSSRLCRTFMPDGTDRRPCHGDDRRFAEDPDWRELVLFYEYFHGDSGRGLSATHQTGWTALVVQCLADAHKSLG
jgi:hypothetical protein